MTREGVNQYQLTRVLAVRRSACVRSTRPRTAEGGVVRLLASVQGKLLLRKESSRVEPSRVDHQDGVWRAWVQGTWLDVGLYPEMMQVRKMNQSSGW